MVLAVCFFEITARSPSTDRGSAYAFLNAALAASLLLGSVGAAPIMRSEPLTLPIAVGIAALVVSIVICTRNFPRLHGELV
jgi:hypothetical protein